MDSTGSFSGSSGLAVADDWEEDYYWLDRVRDDIAAWLDWWPVTLFMTLAIIYALFGDDIRLAWCPISSDGGFFVTSSVVFFVFLVELTLNSFANSFLVPPPQKGYCRPFRRVEGYFLGFFFWLDLIATISMIQEIPWIWEPIVGSTQYDTSDLATARAGRISRLGGRAGRILRLVRLTRAVKLYRIYMQRRHANDAKLSFQIGQPQSKVGARLTDLTTKRVIMGCLLMLIFVPLFSSSVVDYLAEFSTSFCNQLNVDRVPGWTLSYKITNDSLYTWPKAQFEGNEPRLVYLSVGPLSQAALDLEDQSEVFVSCLNSTS